MLPYQSISLIVSLGSSLHHECGRSNCKAQNARGWRERGVIHPCPPGKKRPALKHISDDADTRVLLGGGPLVNRGVTVKGVKSSG